MAVKCILYRLGVKCVEHDKVKKQSADALSVMIFIINRKLLQ